MVKKLFCMLAAVCLILPAFPAAVFAAETEDTPVSNTCGENLTWELDGDTLTISGKGAMDDFEKGAPWQAHKDSITEVVMKGVTYVGACAFQDYDRLTQVDFGNALTEIGKQAFQSCDGLTSITLPATFKVFGEESFRSCKNLEEINCNGKFPSFRQNCLWDTYVTITYPPKNNWSPSLIAQLEEAFHGRVEFLMSDGTDPYVPTEETEATKPEETEEPTELTEPEETEVTEAVTEPETEPETQPVTEPEATEPETQPAPTAPAATAPAETPENQKEFGSSGGKIGLVIVTVIVAVMLLGAVVFRPRRKGKYSAGRKKTGGRRR